MPLLRVSARIHPIRAAKAIVGLIHTHQHAEIQALGPSAVQQVAKAILRATAHLEDEGIDIIVSKVRFIKAGADHNEKEGYRFIIEQCRRPGSSDVNRLQSPLHGN